MWKEIYSKDSAEPVRLCSLTIAFAVWTCDKSLNTHISIECVHTDHSTKVMAILEKKLWGSLMAFLFYLQHPWILITV